MWSPRSEIVTVTHSTVVSTKESDGSGSVPINLCSQKPAVAWGQQSADLCSRPKNGSLRGTGHQAILKQMPANQMLQGMIRRFSCLVTVWPVQPLPPCGRARS